jgi:hypothetical protein
VTAPPLGDSGLGEPGGRASRQIGMRRSWLYLVLPVVCGALLAGCGTRSADPPSSAARPPTVTASAPATPAAAARADARSLLGLFQPPPGARQLASAPKPVPELLGLPNPDSAGGNPTRVLLTDWWSYPGTPQQAANWFTAHPARGTVDGAQGYGNAPGGTALYLSFDRTPTAQLAERSLGISAGRVGGSTLLRVDAESVWVPTRPADAAVPAGVTSVVVVEQPPGRNGTLPGPVPQATATDPQVVRQLVTAINGLPLPVPGAVTSCGAAAGRSLRLTFYRGGAATPVATAQVLTGGCGGVDLSVLGGAQQVALDSSPLLAQALARLPHRT